MAKNSNRILGRNTSTPPTPPIMPSVRRDLNQLSLPAGQNPAIVLPAQSKNRSSQPIGYSPILNVIKKTRYINIRKIGSPRTRFITTASIMSLVLWRDSTVLFTVSWHAPDMKPYLRSAIIISGSSPKILLRCSLLAVTASSTSRLWIFAVMSLSCSNSFTDSHRGPYFSTSRFSLLSISVSILASSCSISSP